MNGCEMHQNDRFETYLGVVLVRGGLGRMFGSWLGHLVRESPVGIVITFLGVTHKVHSHPQDDW